MSLPGAMNKLLNAAVRFKVPPDRLMFVPSTAPLNRLLTAGFAGVPSYFFVEEGLVVVDCAEIVTLLVSVNCAIAVCEAHSTTKRANSGIRELRKRRCRSSFWVKVNVCMEIGDWMN